MKTIFGKTETRYILETTSGATSSAVVATAEKSLGELQRRETMSVPVNQKPRQGPLKPQTGGGKHRDKKKEQKLGKEKHRKPFAEGHDNPDHEISMASNELQSIAADAKKLLMLVKRYSEMEGLEAWQQSKITKAADYMTSVLRSIGGEQGALDNNLNEYETHTYKDSQGNVWRVNDEGEKELVRAAPGSSGGGSRYGSRYPRHNSRPSGMYFYNVKPEQADDAAKAGLKQTKSGKWYSSYQNSQADKMFGPGRYWEPKSESAAEGLTKQARARKEAESVKAAIERLEQQLKDPNPHIDKDDIRRRLETEKRRLELYRDVLDEQGMAEGSGPKEKQKTPYRDINSAEYRAAAEKQKQQMAKDKAAEPGKKLLAKKGVAEGSSNRLVPGKFYLLGKDKKVFTDPGAQAPGVPYEFDDSEEVLDFHRYMHEHDWFTPVKFDGNNFQNIGDVAEGSSNRLVPGKFYLLGKDKKVFTDPGAGVSGIPFEFDDSEEVLDFHRYMHEHDWFTPVKFDGNNFQNIGDVAEEKQKGVDGKACWKGYKRMGTKQKGGRTVDNCVKVGEEETNESGLLAWAGRKKHGADYMNKASAAARKGASQEELGRLKDKFSKAAKKEDTYMENLWAQLGNAVNEKAPEGAKYKRMAKHIKASYKGSGLDDEEIAQRAFGATWKAAKRAKK